MAKRLDVVLHSDYPPETCLAKLSGDIDIDQFTLFSFSGYRGSKPILGRIEGNEFRLHKRRHWHNSWGPVLFCRITPYGRGALIEGYWGTWKWPRIYMQVWLMAAAILGMPIFFATLYQLITGKSVIRGDVWVGLVVPPSMLVFGWLLPRLGAALSFHERKHIVELLNRAVIAGEAPHGDQGRTWRTSLDGGWR